MTSNNSNVIDHSNNNNPAEHQENAPVPQQPAAAAVDNQFQFQYQFQYQYHHKMESPEAHAHVLPPDPSMLVSDRERVWALALKESLLDSDRLHTGLTDMAVMQHAIVARGNVAEALVRIEGLQQFFQEYNLDHSVEQALYYLNELMNQQPGYILHFDVSPLTYDAILVIDSAALFGDRALASDDSWRKLICGLYYVHYTLWPTLATVRQGLSSMVECDSVGWHNFGYEYITRSFEEVMSYLPVTHKSIRAYNTTVVANLLFSAARPFMPQDMKRSVQLGHQIEAHADAGVSSSSSSSSSQSHGYSMRRLSEFYLQPDLSAAQQRILQRAECLLRVRKLNEETFRLS